jgi:hypothetical protein
MLAIFKKDVAQPVSPQSQAQKVEDACARIKDTKTRLHAATNELETFAKRHNLIFDELGIPTNFYNCAIHWPPEVANEYKTLTETRNDALRAFWAALANYAAVV